MSDRPRFIATKEYRRFTEFADAVRRQHTIGLCYGQAGVGKTISARRYSRWDQCQPLLDTWGPREDSDYAVYAALAKTRTVLYTPFVLTTPRQLKDELDHLAARVAICVEQHLAATGKEKFGPYRHLNSRDLDMIIVDEADRLNATAIELLRDRYDRDNIALLLIGMPGIEKQVSRYPQFYSRVGFAHQYRPLGADELQFVLTRQWRHLGLTLDPDDFTDAQAVAATARITRGNFRLIERLFTQVDRVMKINELHTITADVIDAARSTLVIGLG